MLERSGVKDCLRLLVVGDVVGKPGRQVFSALYPVLQARENIHFCIVNAENAAGGSGLDEKTVAELLSAGADVLTSGDHVWRNREIFAVINRERRVLRPANFPAGAPGKGSGIFITRSGLKVGVVNLLGRVFMDPLVCPFQCLGEELKALSARTRLIVVDFHAEATSEKLALAYYCDGMVSALLGTHTHIPTADERILPRGTAYVTDIGMTGGIDSILGREVEPVIKKFLYGLPVVLPVSRSNLVMQGAIIEIDPASGKALEIRRVSEPMPG